MNPKPGDFFLTQIKGVTRLAGRTRRWIELGQWLVDDTSRWSHAGCIVDDGKVVEAMPGGARITSLEDATQGMTTYSSWDIPDYKREDLVKLAYSYLGIGYSYLDYAALASASRGVDFAWLRKYIDDSGHMICSQLVDHWYTSVGLHPFSDNRWPGYVTPGDLELALRGPQSGDVGDGRGN